MPVTYESSNHSTYANCATCKSQPIQYYMVKDHMTRPQVITSAIDYRPHRALPYRYYQFTFDNGKYSISLPMQENEAENMTWDDFFYRCEDAIHECSPEHLPRRSMTFSGTEAAFIKMVMCYYPSEIADKPCFCHRDKYQIDVEEARLVYIA
jgi:hypothetical protein